MNIKVTKDNVCIIDKEYVHEGEYKINELSFEFSEEYTPDLVINAVFTNELGKAYQVSVIDGKCQIPAEILAETGQILLGVYAYKINNEELELRYSPFPTSFNVISGSYDSTAEESQEITPTQFEQYMQALNDGLNQVKDSISKLDNATKNANDLVDEINQKLENGDFIGPQGPIGPQGEPGKDGTNGIDGVGITTITSGQATEENGNTITPITVEKTDGSSETFNVSAKNGIDGKNGQNGKDGINGTNGIDGQDGITPNIQIGTVETLEPTEEATVTRTGTDEEPVFNFGIPKGQQGEQGIPGQDGQPGVDGQPGQDGVDGKDATINGQNTVEITTDNNITLDQQESVLKLGLNSQLILKQDVEGTDNTFDDGLESPLFTLGGDGQSIQDGTPTPDTPVEINSIEGSLEFACNGRNLLPNNASSQTINDVTFIVKDDGSVIINGTATARAILLLFANNENPIKLIPGNYSLNSGKTSGGSFLQIEVKNLLGESRYITSSNTSNNYVVIDEGDVLVAGYIGLDQGQMATNDHIYPVFQKGATSTKYEQYVEPNQVTFDLGEENLRSVGDVKDELVVDLETGDYYKLNNIRHLELAISDMNNAEKYPGWNNTPFIKEDFPNLQTSLNKNNSSILCNILTQPTDLSTSGIGINTIDGEILYLSKSKFNLTQTQWKEQYPDLIFKLDYVIPDTEKIKLGTLSSEDLAKLKTFKGYNNVTVNTNLGLMNIRFTYGLDIKKYVDNKIAEISTAMIEEG